MRTGPDKPASQFQRGFKRDRVGLALSGNVKGRAVVRAGAHKREAERHVDAIAEGDHFERRKALVVVHAHDRVETAVIRVVKNLVARERALGRDSRTPRAQHGGTDLGFVFPAGFFAVGIQRADREPRL